MKKPWAGPSFLGTFALVLLAIAALFVADTFLAKAEQTANRVEATRLFRQGQALLHEGKNEQAIEEIEDAISTERDNRGFLRTLAEAQFAAGRTSDAEATLNDLLETDSTDGFANLMLARVLAKEGRFDQATSYFHRAIYGHWTENAAENQLRARFELVDLLAMLNAKEELLAELLSIQNSAPQNLTVRARLGRLFLLAGSPTRSVEVFREILRDVPADTDAYAGLGEADFAYGDYRAAQHDFENAVRLAPNDQSYKQRLDLIDDLLNLDPTVRNLGVRERFNRSHKLLEMTANDASQCAGANPPADLKEMIENAETTLQARVIPSRQSDDADENIDLAERLWQARTKECSAAPPVNSPLALVLTRLAQ